MTHLNAKSKTRARQERVDRGEDGTLATFNECRTDDKQRHATKGDRRISVRRSRAQYLMGHFGWISPAMIPEARKFMRGEL